MFLNYDRAKRGPENLNSGTAGNELSKVFHLMPISCTCIKIGHDRTEVSFTRMHKTGMDKSFNLLPVPMFCLSCNRVVLADVI